MPDAEPNQDPAPVAESAEAIGASVESALKRRALKPRDVILAAFFAGILATALFYWRMAPTQAERDAQAYLPTVIQVLEAGEAEAYLTGHDYSRYYARQRRPRIQLADPAIVERFDTWGPPLLADLRLAQASRAAEVRELNRDQLVTYRFDDGATVTLRFVEAEQRWTVATNRI